jgi:hypothetical protein
VRGGWRSFQGQTEDNLLAVPYSAACPQSTGVQLVEGWPNDGISVNGLGRGFRMGGTSRYESVRPRTGTGTLEVIAKSHKRFRSLRPEEVDLLLTAEEGNWPVPTTRQPSPTAPEDRNGEAKMRWVRSQEDPRCRNSAAEPTESGEDVGQVTKPREVGALVEGGPLIKMPGLTSRSAGLVRENCVKEDTAGYVNVHRLGEPVGGSRRCEFNGGRSSGSQGPGNQDDLDRDEQAPTMSCGTTPAGGNVGPDRKEGLGVTAAAEATRRGGKVDREPGTVGLRIDPPEDGRRDTGEREAESEAPRGNEPENRGDEPGNLDSRRAASCGHSGLCRAPSDPETDRTEPGAAAVDCEGCSRVQTRTRAAGNQAACPRSNREEEPENQETSQRPEGRAEI